MKTIMKKLFLLIGLTLTLGNVSAMNVDAPKQVTAQVPQLNLTTALALVDQEQQRPGSVEEQVEHVLKDKEQQRFSHLLHHNSTAVLYDDDEDDAPKANVPQYNYDGFEDDDALEAASELGDEKAVQALLEKLTIKSEDINGAYHKARHNIKPLLKEKYVSLFKEECARWSKERLYLIQGPLKSPMIKRGDLEKILQEAQDPGKIKDLFILVLQKARKSGDPDDQVIIEKLMFLQLEPSEQAQQEPVQEPLVQNPGFVQNLQDEQLQQEEPVVEETVVQNFEFNEVKATVPQEEPKGDVQNLAVAQAQAREALQKELINEFFNKTETRAELKAFLQRMKSSEISSNAPKILFEMQNLMPKRLHHAVRTGNVEIVNYLLGYKNFTEQTLQKAWNIADAKCKLLNTADKQQDFIEIKMALRTKLPPPPVQKQHAEHVSKTCVIL